MVWDVESGQPEHSLTPTGPGWTIEFDAERRLLYAVGPKGAISVWDLSGSRRGEIGTIDINSWVQSNSIAGTRSSAAFTSFQFPDFDAIVRAFGPDSGELGASIDVNMVTAPAVLPDDRIVVFPEPGDEEVGPVVVWDPDDGSQTPLVGCRAFIGDAEQTASVEDGEATCVDGRDEWLPAVGLFIDPAGELLLISTADGEMLTFDAHTLEPIDRAFFDDGSSSVEAFGGDWIVFSDVATNVPVPTTTTTIVDRESFDVIAEIPGGVPEIDEDASRLALYAGPGEIAIYDTSTWELLTTLRAGEARIRGLEFSPDGSMLASGAVDGFLRIWDVDAGEELHRIPIESPSDAYWIDDEHLAVGTQWGLWTTITLNTDELIGIAVDRLTRGFTDEDCATYRIDPCRTLEELRSG
jgi:WD40 repeat protein